MSYVSEEKIKQFLKNLFSNTANSAQRNQVNLVPLVVTCDGSSIANDANHIINFECVDRYRYNSRWYHCRYSVDKPNETFGAIRIEDVLTTELINKIPDKHFIGTIARLVHQGFIKPFILYLDGELISWDDLELVFDSGDTWLLVRNHNYYALSRIKDYRLLICPFKCEFLGPENEASFNLRYDALASYIQSSTKLVDNNFYIQSPTLETEYEYNHMMFNIGGWAYIQIKKYKLGLLSDDQIKRLRNIQVTLTDKDLYGNIKNTLLARYNLLDNDVPTDAELHSYVYGRSASDYDNLSKMSFNSTGLYSEHGQYNLYLMDENCSYEHLEFSDIGKIWDLSSIEGLLFRENFLVFVNGEFVPGFKILTSINNIVYFPNPERKTIHVVLMYRKDLSKVIRNSDRFMRDYMNEQAKLYFEAILQSQYAGSQPNISLEDHLVNANVYNGQTYKAITSYDDASTDDTLANPQDIGNAVLLNTTTMMKPDDLLSSLHAQDTDNHMIRNIQAYELDMEVAFVPSLTEYIVFINSLSSRKEVAISIINRIIEPLKFEFSNSKSNDQNLQDAFDSVLDYDVNLFNKLYKTSVESYTFTGAYCNENMVYKFMYEDRIGLKIPRKRYRHHETYFMMFVNGELIPNYYQTVCYANFFFIPTEPDFKFEDDDRIEILYFKYVNNNELRFFLSDWLLDNLEDNRFDVNFFNTNIFNPWIDQEELKIFAHYPRDMLVYPTLIPEESEDIAFNITYQDETGQKCIRKKALTHMISEEIARQASLYPLPGDIHKLVEIADVDMYRQAIKDNIYITQAGINIFNKDAKTTRNALVATSAHKFIYQRLFINYPAYRIRLDRRFRYCDNPKQYLLFINGRRMRQDSFLVTIPKHTRPFNAMYLYTAKFVKPTDRIELFYLPYEMTDINFPEDKRVELNKNGYLTYPRGALDVPLSRDLYMFFINGKKIPAADIIDVDSSTIRVNVDTNTLHYPMITAINLNKISSVVDYLHDDEQMSTYDALIKFIRNHRLGYKELDRMLGASITMSDNESDKIWLDVAKIAILNEVIRDFWVTSGYDYNNQPFVYDYDTDEYFEKSEDGILGLPALDANPSINIKRNSISLLYFYTDPANLLIELGSTINKLKFYWEYSQRLNQPWRIISQSLNDRDIDIKAREYEWDYPSDPQDTYTFLANTGQQYIKRVHNLEWVNGTYWGLIDKDALQFYQRLSMVQYMDEMVAVLPKNKIIPSSLIQEIESGNERYKEHIVDNNDIVYGLSYGDEDEPGINLWADPSLKNIYDEQFLAERIVDKKRLYNPIDLYPRPDRADDLLYTSISSIMDGQLVPDLELVDIYRETFKPDLELRDFNILNEGFKAITDDREFNLMKIVTNLWFEFPDDNVYNAETNSTLMAIRVDDGLVIRGMSYNAIYTDKPETDLSHIIINRDDFIATADDPIMTGTIGLKDIDSGNVYFVDSLDSEDDLDSEMYFNIGYQHIWADENGKITVRNLDVDLDLVEDLRPRDSGSLLVSIDTVLSSHDNNLSFIGGFVYENQVESRKLDFDIILITPESFMGIIKHVSTERNHLTYIDLDTISESDSYQILSNDLEEIELTDDVFFTDYDDPDNFDFKETEIRIGSLDADLDFVLKDNRETEPVVIMNGGLIVETNKFIRILDLDYELVSLDDSPDLSTVFINDAFFAVTVMDEHGQFDENTVFFDIDTEQNVPIDMGIWQDIYYIGALSYAEIYSLPDSDIDQGIGFEEITDDGPSMDSGGISSDDSLSMIAIGQFSYSLISEDYSGDSLPDQTIYALDIASGDIYIGDNSDFTAALFDDGLDKIDIGSFGYHTINDLDTGTRVSGDHLTAIDILTGEEFDLDQDDKDYLWPIIDTTYIEILTINPKLGDEVHDLILVDERLASEFYAILQDGTSILNLTSDGKKVDIYNIRYINIGIRNHNGDLESFEYFYDDHHNIDLINPNNPGFMAIIIGKNKSYSGLSTLPVVIQYRYETIPILDVNKHHWIAEDNDNQSIDDVQFIYDSHDNIDYANPTAPGFKAILSADKSLDNLQILYHEKFRKYRVRLDQDNVVLYNSIDDYILRYEDTDNDFIETYDAEHLTFGTVKNGVIDSGIEYIFDPVETMAKYRNFFNWPDGQYMAINDDKKISDIGLITVYDEYYKDLHQIINVDVDWFKTIYPERNDVIERDFVLAVSNSASHIRHHYPYNINDLHFILLTGEEYDIINRHQEDLTISSNSRSETRDIGFLDLIRNNGVLAGVLDGSAKILRGIDYQIDGKADNTDVVIYEYNNTIYAFRLDGTLIENFEYENHEYSWSNQHLINISDLDFIAIEDGGEVYNQLIFFHDPNRPEIRYFYDESHLPAVLRTIDKHLVPEPPHVQFNNHRIGNNNYFIFACPKRVVYDGWKCLTSFKFPSIDTPEFIENCTISGITPIYTDGKIDNLTKLLSDIHQMKMDYMGECKYTNDYGYTEPYMVWKTNGYFTRLKDLTGLDMLIKIGNSDAEPIIFNNNIQQGLVIEDDEFFYYTSEEGIDVDQQDQATNTVRTHVGGKKSSVYTKSRRPKIKTVMMGRPETADRDKMLLEKGIFLL